uniref:Uncharacterized protein n=1 Tax=Aplanochytrium stocchinoi TaxID=215587 RepID=A0A7S3PMA0_9STRA|mmetsp:Transcript_13870/g.16092  ORF Transcript_13870/g.16092 Transcript_13870/m.16092 type:complete len:103 (-) Transcript_13870:433-741(-)
MFEIPVPNSLADQLDFTQDIGHGTENRVIWEFQHHGYHSFNPCEIIHAYHYHCSGERKYKDKGKVISQAKYNNGVRKHGFIKPYWWSKYVSCPFPIGSGLNI